MNSGSYLVPRLKIVKQNSLTSVVTIKDGQSQTIHTVVKNSPFIIQVGLDTSVLHDSATLTIVENPTTVQPLNLTHVTLDAKLLYDNLEQKEVDFVKHKPLDYKLQSVNESGTEAQIECRLKVLTSQLEDMHFRIKFQAILVQTEVCFMTAITDPIKVISKPERPPPDKRPRPNPGKRKTNNDILLETLTSVHQRQTQQQEMLKQLMQFVSKGSIAANPNSTAIPAEPAFGNPVHTNLLPATAAPAPPVPPVNVPGNSGSQSMFWEPAKKKHKLDDDRPLDFETAFRDLMDAFDALAPEKRGDYMRNFIRNNNTSPDELSELHDMFSSEGLGRSIGMEISSGGMPSAVPSPFPGMPNMSRTPMALDECRCENCPHRNELNQLELFYKELFFS